MKTSTPIHKRKNTISQQYRCPVCTLPSPCPLHELCKVDGCVLPLPCVIHDVVELVEEEIEENENGPRRARKGSIDAAAVEDKEQGEPHLFTRTNLASTKQLRLWARPRVSIDT